ncbi:diaminopimelate epimerase [Nocardioides donggukensis]|uniref:Diaminopimelate epimerase n=1 Tax=Nocardioides donggukensis TaxID=2774019 RepID=A0A927K5H1_9ACTN|nr:diaminopimelate epimerase [Nocardioides donggukensis]MBD8870652.1 diaminopimelate epimerase [Nocardioides donggukensis]
MTTPAYPFVKGHGTENDFVLLPDHDGSVHGDLPAARVAALCDRRAGIGGDGVIRVIRTAALADAAAGTEWFMDYRNADGSVSEMCGNGVRVLARHLADEGLVDPAEPLPLGTRDGVKTVVFEADGTMTVDMGSPRLLGDSEVAVGERAWKATHVDMGNPHAVAFVGSLDDAGSLLEPPEHDRATYPHGVNVEFVVRRGARHVAFRVHERGSGETRSCGTGACAVMVAAAVADGEAGGDAGPPGQDLAYTVDVPGGRLTVTWTAGDRTLLTGPAVLVARGTSTL